MTRWRVQMLLQRKNGESSIARRLPSGERRMRIKSGGICLSPLEKSKTTSHLTILRRIFIRREIPAIHPSNIYQAALFDMEGKDAH